MLAAPPTVSITSPADGGTWGATKVLQASATATDLEGPVAKVEFYLDDSLTATDTTIQSGTLGGFSVVLSPRPAPGDHTLTARAYDGAGEIAFSATHTIHVTPPPPPPTVVTGSVEATATWAYVHGTVNPRNSPVSHRDVWVEFGLSTNYGGTTKGGIFVIGTAFEDDTAHPVLKNLNSLERNTTYHYRVAAESAWGIGYGEDATFTTPANLPPTAGEAFGSVSGTDAAAIYCDFGDPDNEPVTITSVSAPSHGTVAIGSTVEGADLTYTPGASFETTDEFTYTVTDQHGASATATVRVFNLRQTAPGQYILTIVTETGPLRAVGAVGLSVTGTGVFTGAMNLFGVRYPLRGRFSTDGNFVTEIDRPGAPPLQLSLGQWGGPHGVQIGGMVGGHMINSGSKLAFPENAAEAGSYTMALPTNNPEAPLGDGYITGKVSRRGRVVFAGRIGDGQPFSFGTQLRQGGTADLFVTAGTAPRDRIHGRLQFPDAARSECTGEMIWYKAPRTNGYFQAGLLSTIQVAGSRLVLTDEEDEILNYSTELAGLAIHFEDLEGKVLLDGSLSGPDEDSLVFDEGSLLTASPAQARTTVAAPGRTVTMNVNRRTGAFSGTFRNPAEAGRLRNFSGVLLQHQNAGSGLLMFGGRTGLVTLAPK